MSKQNIKSPDDIKNIQKLFTNVRDVKTVVLTLNQFLEGGLRLIDDFNSLVTHTGESLPKAQKSIYSALNEVGTAVHKIGDQLDGMEKTLKKIVGSEGIKDKRSQQFFNDIQKELIMLVEALLFYETSQQDLNMANQIIQKLDNELKKLSENIAEVKISEDLRQKIYAQLNSKEQPEFDTIKEVSKEKIHQNGISQDDIEALFDT